MTQLSDMGVEAAPAWQPAGDIVTHAGQAVPPDMDFFVHPPPEIGEVVTAYSTLRKHKREISPGTRYLVAGAVGAGLYLAVTLGLGSEFEGATTYVAIGAGLLGLALVLAVTQFRHVCSFVGRLGIARFELHGSRHGQPRPRMLEFRTADRLYTHSVRQYVNGIYSGTTYSYTWHDPQGRKVFRLNGNYRSKQDRPKPSHPYWLARQAEGAWSDFLLASLQGQLESKGYVEFMISDKQRVRLAPGRIDFVFPDRVETMTLDELGDVKAAEGVIHFKHKDARWFSGKGKFHFQYARIPNALLFLMCMEKLLGLRFN